MIRNIILKHKKLFNQNKCDHLNLENAQCYKQGQHCSITVKGNGSHKAYHSSNPGVPYWEDARDVFICASNPKRMEQWRRDLRMTTPHREVLSLSPSLSLFLYPGLLSLESALTLWQLKTKIKLNNLLHRGLKVLGS